MAPTKSKQCCVPHCPNSQDNTKKQFFRIGANLEARDKFRIGRAVAPKSSLLNCCEDHFDLPNDASNYIRYKYCPGTKLKLRPDTLPHRKLPVNVCRLCLNIIYNGDDMVDISPAKGGDNSKIVATLLSEIDLSLTTEPVVCMKCFDPLEKCYKLKRTVLSSEISIVNCIRSIARRSPKRLLKSCEIDLFDEYNDIKKLLQNEKEKSREAEVVGSVTNTQAEDLENLEESQTGLPNTSENLAQADSHDKHQIGGKIEYMAEPQEQTEGEEIVIEVEEDDEPQSKRNHEEIVEESIENISLEVNSPVKRLKQYQSANTDNMEFEVIDESATGDHAKQ